MKPKIKAECKWFIWKRDYPSKRRLNKFSKWEKKYMNRVRRRNVFSKESE